MMKKVIMLLSVLLLLSTMVQAEDEIELTCQEQQDVKYCVDKNGKAYSGKYAKRNSEGILLSVENYRNGYLNGLATYWTEKGKLKERLYYKKGVKNGDDKVYYENRTYKYLLNYKDGLLNGKIDIYTDDGKLKGRIYYYKGKIRKGFCVDDKGKKVKLTYEQIIKYPDNQLEKCGVE